MFEKIISRLRSVALVGAMAFLFMVVGLNVDSENNLAMILFLCAIVFIVLEVCGIIYRCIRAGKARTEEQQKFLMMFFYNNATDLIVSDTLRRISGLGIIAVIICVILRKPIGDLLSSQYTGFSFLQLFAAFSKWSLVAFPIMAVVSVLKLWYILPHIGEGAYSMGTIIIKYIGGDFTCLFHDIKYLISSEKKKTYIIKTVLGIGLIIFVVLGIIML